MAPVSISAILRSPTRFFRTPDKSLCLSDFRIYQRQLDQLHEKYLFTPKLYELRQDQVSLASMSMKGAKVAKLIAKSVALGEYRLQPGTVREISVKGKVREVYSFGLTDLIVHRAIAHVIEEAMSPHLSHRLFSYRKGVSWK